MVKGLLIIAALVTASSLALIPMAYQRASDSGTLPSLEGSPQAEIRPPRDIEAITPNRPPAPAEGQVAGAGSSVSATGKLGSLELTITLEKTTFSKGEIVKAVLTLKNTGSEVMFLESTPEQVFSVAVYDKDTIFVGLWTKPKNLRLAPVGFVILAPGESHRQTLMWSGKFVGLSGNLVEIGLGTYYLQGQSGLAAGTEEMGPEPLRPPLDAGISTSLIRIEVVP